MGRDVTFEDLVDADHGGSRTKEGSAEQVPEQDDESAEWLFKTVQYLDDRGYLERLLEQSALGEQNGGGPPRAGAGGREAIGDDRGPGRQVPTTENDADADAETAETPDDMNQDIDAETIAQALKRVYDLKGNISLKELIQLVEQNEAMVNELLESEL